MLSSSVITKELGAITQLHQNWLFLLQFRKSRLPLMPSNGAIDVFEPTDQGQHSSLDQSIKNILIVIIVFKILFPLFCLFPGLVSFNF